MQLHPLWNALREEFVTEMNVVVVEGLCNRCCQLESLGVHWPPISLPGQSPCSNRDLSFVLKI